MSQQREHDAIHQHIAHLAMCLMTQHFIRDAMRESLMLEDIGELRDKASEIDALTYAEACHVRTKVDLITCIIEKQYPVKQLETQLVQFGVDTNQITFGGRA